MQTPSHLQEQHNFTFKFVNTGCAFVHVLYLNLFLQLRICTWK